MRTLLFCNEINQKTISDFIDLMEEKIEKGEQHFVIYFESIGGEAIYGELLINYINEVDSRNKYSVKVYAIWDITSSAFNIFFKLNCERDIIFGTFGIIHYATRDVDAVRIKNKNSSDSFFLENLEEIQKNDLIFYKTLGISEDELSRLKKGEDVYLNYNRLRELLNNQIKT